MPFGPTNKLVKSERGTDCNKGQKLELKPIYHSLSTRDFSFVEVNESILFDLEMPDYFSLGRNSIILSTKKASTELKIDNTIPLKWEFRDNRGNLLYSELSSRQPTTGFAIIDVFIEDYVPNSTYDNKLENGQGTFYLSAGLSNEGYQNGYLCGFDVSIKKEHKSDSQLILKEKQLNLQKD